MAIAYIIIMIVTYEFNYWKLRQNAVKHLTADI